MLRNACLLTLGCVSPLLAQTGAAATITAGNVTFTQSALPATNTTLPGTADVLNTGGGDPLYQHWWWFRVGGDSRQFVFSNNGSATRVANSPTMITVWPDVDARGVFSATLVQTAVSTGATSGFVREDLTVTNLTPNQITLDLFAYTDLDVGGTSNNARGNLNSHVVQNATPNLSAECFAVGNTATEVRAFSGLRTSINSAAVYDLAGWTGTFGPGDYTGAFQWTLTLAPNASATVTDYLAVHAIRPQLNAYGTGLAGSNGTPQIAAPVFLLQDGIGMRNSSITLANGVPNGLAVLLLNLNQANQTMLGLQLYVDPVGADTTFVVANGTGGATRPFNLPASPNFGGASLYGQWLVLDPTVPNGLASYSGGLQMLLGRW